MPVVRQTQRDLLPLPTGEVLANMLDELKEEQGAALTGRRGRVTDGADRWLQDGIMALNDMGGRGSRFTAARPSEAQAASVRRLRPHYQYVYRKMQHLEPEQAWRELAHVKAGYTAEVSPAVGTGRVASFRDGAVKLPRGGAGHVALTAHLPAVWSEALETGAGILRDEPYEVCEGTPAVDPVLRRGGYDYGRFLGELLDAGIIDISDDPLSQCGVFFVHRKDNMLRLIFDPRHANDKCHVPPHTGLPSPAALSQLECPEASTIHLSSGDVEVAFYQYSIPKWLRRHFTLPGIRWKFLPKRLREVSLARGGRPVLLWCTSTANGLELVCVSYADGPPAYAPGAQLFALGGRQAALSELQCRWAGDRGALALYRQLRGDGCE